MIVDDQYILNVEQRIAALEYEVLKLRQMLAPGAPLETQDAKNTKAQEPVPEKKQE